MGKKFCHRLYDKKVSSPFLVMRMPHSDSNIPNNIFYSIFVCETLPIASCFLPNVHELVSRIRGQGGKMGKCHSHLKK